MLRVYHFRMYASKYVERKLFSNFDVCRDLYNYSLENKIFDVRVLPQFKREHPEYANVHSIVLQNVIFQLQDNLTVLKALKAKGNRVGRLRVKKRFHSMIYEQSGFKIDGDTLFLSKVGRISMKISKPILGIVKQVTVKHNKTHKWFASLVCDDPVEPLKSIGRKAVGIDLNVSNFCVDSDGLVVEHPPATLRKQKKRLATVQRQLSRKKKSSCNRLKQRCRVAVVHERVENLRDDFLHKLSRYYVNRYDPITFEDFDIAGLFQINGSSMRKAMLDASWDKFTRLCVYKAESAGKRTVKVAAADTTRECSRCGTLVPEPLLGTGASLSMLRFGSAKRL